jgi:hypothetical protein
MRAAATPLRPVSGGFNWAETAISLILCVYLLAISLFHDFWEVGSRISRRGFRPWLGSTRAAHLLSGNRETAQQRPISITKTNSWLFQPALKQHETVRNSQRTIAGTGRWRS